jgi:hypothetical protein
VKLAGPSGRFAATGLRDHPRRAGLTTATIAVGVAVVAWLSILARSFEGSVVDALGRAIRADLVVTSTNIGSGFLEAPLADEILGRIGEFPSASARMIRTISAIHASVNGRWKEPPREMPGTRSPAVKASSSPRAS